MTSSTATTTWNIDPSHTAAEFKVKHMMISNVKGEFSGISGVLNLDESDYEHSTVEISIPAATIRTGDEKRDAHLITADFFDVEKYPAITFKSTRIESTGGSTYSVTGDLTIRDVTRAVTLTVEDVSKPFPDPWGHRRLGLSAFTIVNREDYALKWNMALEAGGFLVGDDVKITLDVQFVSA